MRLKSSEDVD